MPNGTRTIAIAPDLADDLALLARKQGKFEGRSITMRELTELGIDWVMASLAAAEAAGQPLTLRELSTRVPSSPDTSR